MINSNIYLKLNKKDMLFPKRSTLYSAGYDVFSSSDMKINAFSSFELEIPYFFTYENALQNDFEILFVVRSSYGIKKRLRILNEDGKYDRYTTYDFNKNKISILLFNDSSDTLFIPKNEHFLQFVVTKKTDDNSEVSFESTSDSINDKYPSSGFSVFMENNLYHLKTVNKIVIAPKQQVTLPIGMKAKFNKGSWLGATISNKFEKSLIFANSTPVIDADYYNNDENEGLIFLGIVNTSDNEVIIDENSTLCNFWAKPFYLISNDIPPTDTRKGGIGSTTDKN